MKHRVLLVAVCTLVVACTTTHHMRLSPQFALSSAAPKSDEDRKWDKFDCTRATNQMIPGPLRTTTTYPSIPLGFPPSAVLWSVAEDRRDPVPTDYISRWQVAYLDCMATRGYDRPPAGTPLEMSPIE